MKIVRLREIKQASGVEGFRHFKYLRVKIQFFEKCRQFTVGK
jgi:hypothetical protein